MHSRGAGRSFNGGAIDRSGERGGVTKQAGPRKLNQSLYSNYNHDSSQGPNTQKAHTLKRLVPNTQTAANGPSFAATASSSTTTTMQIQ